jgi:hypothetical protein
LKSNSKTAKQEAFQLLMELEANDDDYQNSGDEDDRKQSPKTKGKGASKEEMKQVLSAGEMVASSLKYKTANSVAVSGDINIDVEFHDETRGKTTSGRVIEHSTIFASLPPAATLETATSKKASTPSNKKNLSVSAPTAVSHEDESNPCLASVAAEDDNTDEAPIDSVVNVAKHAFSKRQTKLGFVDVDRAVVLLESTPDAAIQTVFPESNALAVDKKIKTLTRSVAGGVGREWHVTDSFKDMTRPEVIGLER